MVSVSDAASPMALLNNTPFIQQLVGGWNQLQACASNAFQPGRTQQKRLMLRKGTALLPRRVMVSHRAPFAAIIPGDGVVEQVVTSGLSNFLNLYNTALIARLVLTWFPNPPEFIQQPLATICDPYLNLFRGLIPPLGGTLDFSPILAFVVLNLFTNTAAALPAELGPDGCTPLPRKQKQGALQWLQPSKYQRAWAQRMQAQRETRQAKRQSC